MNTSLIPADQHFAVAAALFCIALFGFWAEQRTWGKVVTGTVWSILLAIVASNIGLIPKDTPVYGFVFKFLVPVLIPLFLINANVRQIISESGRVGIAFILACFGTTLGCIMGIQILDLGSREADLAGIFTATYTGGSVNYAAVIQATGFDDAAVISAATAVDNLMSALFLAVLAMMPASKWLVSKFAQRNYTQQDDTVSTYTELKAFNLAAAIAFALTVVAVSDLIVIALNRVFDGFDFSRLRYIFITLISITPATLFPEKMSKLSDGKTIGLVIAFAFFAAIAAGADLIKLVSVAPMLLSFVIIILLVHFLVVFGIGALTTLLSTTRNAGRDKQHALSFSLPELIIASNAAILGATTAPALAMARGWPALATPGILAGVAGYIIGTPLGIFVASMF